MHHKASHAWKVTVYLTLQTFTFWYDQQVLRKANNPTDMTSVVLDEEYTASLQLLVSTCLGHSQYIAIMHDGMRCSGKLSADVVQTMLECGGDCYIDSLDKHGKRPLHVAVQSGKPELVSLLMEFDAHLDAVNCEGSTNLLRPISSPSHMPSVTSYCSCQNTI